MILAPTMKPADQHAAPRRMEDGATGVLVLKPAAEENKPEVAPSPHLILVEPVVQVPVLKIAILKLAHIMQP